MNTCHVPRDSPVLSPYTQKCVSDGNGVCPKKILWNFPSNVMLAVASGLTLNLSVVMHIDLSSDLIRKIMKRHFLGSLALDFAMRSISPR